MTIDEILSQLRRQANPDNLAGMARYGIVVDRALGVPMPGLRSMAKEIGKNHVLAVSLWDTGIHEARILASLIDTPDAVTTAQLQSWVAQIDSWDVCDQAVMNLFAHLPDAVSTAVEWSGDTREFVKRAGFVIMARLASGNRMLQDDVFERFLGLVEREAGDSRNFVKKAVNWALREIGARNERLRAQAVQLAEALSRSSHSTTRWIGNDASRVLLEKAATGRVRHLGQPPAVRLRRYP